MTDLLRISHPNLPQMIGFSAEGAPTPFILLSNGMSRLVCTANSVVH